MSDEYDDIARRLRDEGQASAPPELLLSVMAEVQAAPRSAPARRLRWPARPRWGPVAAWTAGAAAQLALGFGIAHLPSSGSSSSASESVAAAPQGRAPAAGGGVHADTASSGWKAFTVTPQAAKRILGDYYRPGYFALGPNGQTTLNVHVPGAAYAKVQAKLGAAQLNATTAAQGLDTPTIVIKLFRAHHSGTP